jgi:hypothetical protein
MPTIAKIIATVSAVAVKLSARILPRLVFILNISSIPFAGKIFLPRYLFRHGGNNSRQTQNSAKRAGQNLAQTTAYDRIFPKAEV